MSLVITRLIGGLGNQMFQYAAGRALALRRGAVFKLDVTGFTAVGAHTKRRYELDCFPIHGAIANDADLARFGRTDRPGSPRVDRVRRLLRVNGSNDAWPIYREPHFRFDPAVDALSAPVYLDGYWQCERYFSNVTELLRREFLPQAPVDAENAALAAQIDAVNAVSLHVRRGDYVSDPITHRFHGTCSVDYYRQAIDLIIERVGAPHLFVFSDEPQWARAHLRFAVPITVVDVNSPDRGDRDMWLMMRCRHHILANSSFSWWGAWLNPSREKIIVAPRQWFRSSDIDTRDLIPQSWIRL